MSVPENGKQTTSSKDQFINRYKGKTLVYRIINRANPDITTVAIHRPTNLSGCSLKYQSESKDSHQSEEDLNQLLVPPRTQAEQAQNVFTEKANTNYRLSSDAKINIELELNDLCIIIDEYETNIMEFSIQLESEKEGINECIKTIESIQFRPISKSGNTIENVQREFDELKSRLGRVKLSELSSELVEFKDRLRKDKFNDNLLRLEVIFSQSEGGHIGSEFSVLKKRRGNLHLSIRDVRSIVDGAVKLKSDVSEKVRNIEAELSRNGIQSIQLRFEEYEKCVKKIQARIRCQSHKPKWEIIALAESQLSELTSEMETEKFEDSLSRLKEKIISSSTGESGCRDDLAQLEYLMTKVSNLEEKIDKIVKTLNILKTIFGIQVELETLEAHISAIQSEGEEIQKKMQYSEAVMERIRCSLDHMSFNSVEEVQQLLNEMKLRLDCLELDDLISDFAKFGDRVMDDKLDEDLSRLEGQLVEANLREFGDDNPASGWAELKTRHRDLDRAADKTCLSVLSMENRSNQVQAGFAVALSSFEDAKLAIARDKRCGHLWLQNQLTVLVDEVCTGEFDRVYRDLEHRFRAKEMDDSEASNICSQFYELEARRGRLRDSLAAVQTKLNVALGCQFDFVRNVS